jgi:hypothetical protein
MGTEPGGPTPNLDAPEGAPEEGLGQEQPEEESPEQQPEEGGDEEITTEIPEPEEEDIKKYDLGMEDYSKSIDGEDIDWSEEG